MALLKNIQFQQLINLLLLIYIGFNNTTLQTNWFIIFTLMLFSGILELVIKKKQYIPYSAFITALGVVLMVGWTKWYIPFIVIALAIAQKEYLKLGKSHIFNPSNFALVLAIFIFYPKALPIIGELGKGSYIIYAVILIGTFVLIRANRYIITLSFLFSFIALKYLISPLTDPYWNIEHFVSSLYSTSFIVYIFFMLTDPVTTPSKNHQQIYFGFTVTIVIVVLDYMLGSRQWHQFLALFIVTLLFTPFYKQLEEKESIKFTILSILSFALLFYISNLKPLYFSM